MQSTSPSKQAPRTPASTIEAQLQAARARLRGGSVDGYHSDSVERFDILRGSLERLGPAGDAELFKHFPIAAIAALESDFKASVTAIVDSGSPYLERGLQLAKERLKSAADVVPLLHRKSATIGELVAHVIPFNSISSLENAFETLFGTSLKSLVGSAMDPYSLRIGVVKVEPLVADVDALWRELSRTFERRHVLAHEAATNYQVSYNDALSAVASCAAFHEALNGVLWGTVWKDVPLTHYEMNVAAWDRCAAHRKTLAKTLRRALRIATEDGDRARFRRMHGEWKNFSKRWATWEAEPFAMGSIRPLFDAISMERTLAAREDAILGWIERMRPEAQAS